MRPARPGADDIGYVVVPAEEAGLIKIERLPPRMGGDVLGKQDLQPAERLGAYTCARDTEEPRLAQRERDSVVMPEGIAKELEGVHRRPSAVLRKPPKGALRI